jgi:hypothetical protein
MVIKINMQKQLWSVVEKVLDKGVLNESEKFLLKGKKFNNIINQFEDLPKMSNILHEQGTGIDVFSRMLNSKKNIMDKAIENVMNSEGIIQNVGFSSNVNYKWDFCIKYNLDTNSLNFPDNCIQIKTLVIDNSWSSLKLSNSIKPYLGDNVQENIINKQMYLDLSNISEINQNFMKEDIFVTPFLRDLFVNKDLILIFDKLNIDDFLFDLDKYEQSQLILDATGLLQF